jgi:hypothetical protein
MMMIYNHVALVLYNVFSLFTLFAGGWPVLVLMLMLICCERKILLNGWLILADEFKRTGIVEYSYAHVQQQLHTALERQPCDVLMLSSLSPNAVN